jgi:hypothetical protein
MFSDRQNCTATGMYELNEEVVCGRRASGDIGWNWNVGIASPKIGLSRRTRTGRRAFCLSDGFTSDALIFHVG